jgi:hypothetical protein
MNVAFHTVIGARDEERRDLFLTTARRLGTAVQNVEKDFWVCWTLDILFNGLPIGGPRLLFKGGTSLSKGFGLIDRFSEDIDITVFRDDIGAGASVEELEALSGKKRRAKLDAIKAASQTFLNGPFCDALRRQIAETVKAAGIPAGRFRLEPDSDDPDQQTFLLWYPAVTAQPGDYIRSAVKIEAGAKSALDPHVTTTVIPYVNDDLPARNLAVPNVTTVEASRTFWDKVVILHGLRQWHDRRGELRHGGQRVSRHHYDVFRLLQAQQAAKWVADRQLAIDCARHARMFFYSADLGLDRAIPGTLTLAPSNAMQGLLGRDFAAMTGMIFGPAPEFKKVIAAVTDLETRLNRAAGG